MPGQRGKRPLGVGLGQGATASQCQTRGHCALGWTWAAATRHNLPFLKSAALEIPKPGLRLSPLEKSQLADVRLGSDPRGRQRSLSGQGPELVLAALGLPSQGRVSRTLGPSEWPVHSFREGLTPTPRGHGMCSGNTFRGRTGAVGAGSSRGAGDRPHARWKVSLSCCCDCRRKQRPREPAYHPGPQPRGSFKTHPGTLAPRPPAPTGGTTLATANVCGGKGVQPPCLAKLGHY